MPARKQKRKRRVSRARKQTKSRFPFVFFMSSLVLIFVYFIASFLTSQWKGGTKLTLVSSSSESDDVEVIVLDPEDDQITTVKIPGNTEVSVSRGKGDWKLKSAWELGEKEDLSGKILAETVTNNFKFPINSWWESDDFSLDSSIKVVRAVVSPGETSLNFVDRLKVANFILKTNNSVISQIDLAKTTYLRKISLADGSDGFEISGSMPKNLLAVFSDSAFTNSAVTVEIVDATGVYGASETLGEVIQTLGGKIVSVTEVDVEEVECVVSAKDKSLADTVMSVTGCKYEGSDNLNLDLRIKIGKGFAEKL